VIAVHADDSVVNLVGFAVMFLVPYFLDRMTQLPVVLAGAVLATSPLGIVLAGPIGGRLLGRFPAPRLALAGAVLVGVGLLAIGHWDAGTPVAGMVASLVAVGFGLGLFQVTYTDIVTGTLPRADRGVAGSLAMVTRTVGVVGGATCLTIAFAGYTPAGGATSPASFLIPFSATFTTVGAVLLACGGQVVPPPGYLAAAGRGMNRLFLSLLRAVPVPPVAGTGHRSRSVSITTVAARRCAGGAQLVSWATGHQRGERARL